MINKIIKSLIKSHSSVQKISKQISKWLLTLASLFTMVMLPVAQGLAAQNEVALISKAQVQNAMTQLGLNKSITLGEFYKKNKNLYPERVQLQIEEFISHNSNYVMPMFEVTTVKNSEGLEIPTLRISKNGELVNLQIYGEPEKYVKFNNTNLTEIDLINFKDMFLKLNNGDANLRAQLKKQNEKSVLESNIESKKFTGFPELSKDIWSKMSAQDKAEYILNLRALWSDAQKVLILKKSTTSQFEYLWNFLFQKTEAKSPAKVGPSAKVQKDSGTTAEASSENCLVAGYVSSYSNGSCGIKALQDSYKDETNTVNPVITKAQSQCPAGQIACNPFVYGMPGGSAICVSVTDPKFQIATHANGPCDTKSPLGSSVDFLNKDLKNQNRYSAENLKLNPDQLAEEYKKQQSANSAYVENYLKGFLGAGIDFNKELDSAVLDQIVNIKKAFDNDISTAKNSCLAAASNKFNEKNFWGACDQLQRRFLFVAEFLKEKPGCKEGSSINPSTLKCSCPSAGPSQSTNVEVNPGAKCSAAPAPVVTPGASSEKEPSKEPTPDLNANKCEPACSANQKCLKTVSSAEGPEVWECTGGLDKPNKNSKKDNDGWFSGFFKKALPWLVGGVALFAMYKLWSPKKPSLNSAGDMCPNGSRPPCGQVCAAPLSSVNGTCMCASCPPGQSLTNLSTCLCSTTSVGTPVDIICPDGVTHVATLALCPATQYTCWDNSLVTNPINCPVKPVTLPAVKMGK